MSQADETEVRSKDASAAWASGTQRDLTGLAMGDYRIERLLGRGGMGEVYLARQVSLDRPIALKVLKPELISNPTYLARFEKEALSAAKLNHPNIVHIYNFGGFGNLKYIAMEYVEGTNLRDFLAKKGPPDLAVALFIMRQAGQAVAAAGEVGLVHRDIKPENLLLTRRGQVKVADFGLCRAQTDSGQAALTQDGTTLGTPMYMSPEQVRGHELDHRSDLYSLGVSFYQMLAGVPPFRAESAWALALKHIQDTPVHLSVHRPDLPSDLTNLVMKLMAKNPAERYQSASEMLRELARIREAISGPSQTMPLPVEPAPVQPTPSSTPIERTAPVESRQAVRPPRGQLLRGFRIRKREVAAVLLVSAILGGLAGARGRTQDLLGPRSPGPIGPAALWLLPWEGIERQPNAEAQFRFAQFHAHPAERPAAWLAVVGYAPQDRAWTMRAYPQLVRSLFRRGDRDALLTLARALEETNPKDFEALARVARSAAAALADDAEMVIKQFDEHVAIELQNPALNEISLEVILRVERSVGKHENIANRLRTIETKLAEALRLQPGFRLDLTQVEADRQSRSPLLR